MDAETHTPVALPPPPRIRSPAVASITRFDDQDEEDRRQRLLSRCTVQVVNVALLMTAVLLRRLIVRAEPRAGDAATDTIQQKVEKHTGVVFSRAHARFFYEVVATSLGIPFPVLDAVLGVTNSAGAMNDGAGLLLVEKLLHGVQFGAAVHEHSQPDQGRYFDVAPTADPLYGPLMTPAENDEPCKWNATRRGAPSTSYPAVLHVGIVEGGRVPTLGGSFTTGVCVDLSRLSHEFIAAALVAVADGSARRGGEGWANMPQSVDYPSALLTSDPSSQQPSIGTIARSILDLTKKFYSMYVPVTNSPHGISMAKGDYIESMTVLHASEHIAAGREAVAGRLLPPSPDVIPALIPLYTRYRRRDGPGDGRVPKPADPGAGVFGPGEAASGSSADRQRTDQHLVVPPVHLVEIDPVLRRSLKRKCVEESILTVQIPDNRKERLLAWLGFIPMVPTRSNVEELLDRVAESAIAETLEKARARGQAEVQRLVKALNEQLDQVKKQRDDFKDKKQEFFSQLTQAKHDLRLAREDLDEARANTRAAPEMGATDASIFQVALADLRRHCKNLEEENEELSRCHGNALRAKQDMQHLMERLQQTNALESEAHTARVAVLQDALDAQTEQL